jgi:type IV secretory pathway TrbD component
VVGILLALLGLMVSFSLWATLPGVLVIFVGLAACVRSAARDAQSAREAAERYESRRAEILRRLETGE